MSHSNTKINLQTNITIFVEWAKILASYIHCLSQFHYILNSGVFLTGGGFQQRNSVASKQIEIAILSGGF